MHQNVWDALREFAKLKLSETRQFPEEKRQLLTGEQLVELGPHWGGLRERPVYRLTARGQRMLED